MPFMTGFNFSCVYPDCVNALIFTSVVRVTIFTSVVRVTCPALVTSDIHPASLTAEGSPSAPRLVTLRLENATAISISWEPPDVGSSQQIESYTVSPPPALLHRGCTVEPLCCGHLGDLVKCPV